MSTKVFEDTGWINSTRFLQENEQIQNVGAFLADFGKKILSGAFKVV